MADFPSTNVRINSQLSPFTDTQTFPLFDSAHGLGGLRTVGTTAEMNAIFDRRRTRGMMVYVSGVSAYYALIGTTANSGWTTEFQIGTGTNILPLNNTFTGLNTFTVGISAAGITIGSTTRLTQNKLSISHNSQPFEIYGATASSGVAYNQISIPVGSSALQLESATGVIFLDAGLPSKSVDYSTAIRFAGYNSGLGSPQSTSIIIGGGAGNTLTLPANSGTIALTNGVVTSFNGSTGAVGGVTTSTANTFTALQTFNSGISASSGVFGNIQSNSGATFNADVYIGSTLSVNGNLVVNGTTTTINSTTITVDDKNIELGSVISPTDTTADGGGISLKGTTDKTIIWSNVTTGSTLSAAWNFNQDINLTKSVNPAYYINGTVVIDGASLGPNIVNSNLTKVGTIATGVWQGTVIGGTYGGTGLSSYAKGDLLYAAAAGSVLSKLAISTTSGQLIQTDGSNLSWGDLLLADGSGNGVSTLTSGKYRIQDASTSVKGLSRYDSFNFSVAAGVVGITAIDGGSYT
jgi:hypothetical protein